MKRTTLALLTLFVSLLTWNATAAAPAPNPAAPAPKPAYVRPAAPPPPAAAPSSSSVLPKLLAVLLVGGLGGWAVYARKKRRGLGALKGGSGLRVLETARLGPKAALVTAQVGHRVILLGVTDQSISKLGWLSSATDADAELGAALDSNDAEIDSAPPPARNGFSREPLFAPARAATPAPAAEKRRPSDGSFSAKLRSALGASATAPSDDALAVSAQLTRDVVDLRGSRKRAAKRPVAEAPRVDDAMIDVEAQAAGLIRRLKGKNQ